MSFITAPLRSEEGQEAHYGYKFQSRVRKWGIGNELKGEAPRWPPGGRQEDRPQPQLPHPCRAGPHWAGLRVCTLHTKVSALGLLGPSWGGIKPQDKLVHLLTWNFEQILMYTSQVCYCWATMGTLVPFPFFIWAVWKLQLPCHFPNLEHALSQN